MAGRKANRSEETKRRILQAAGELFSAKGYDAVTMREIAGAAGCSHTAIYIYFKDKETLLHELSMPPLLELSLRLEANLTREGVEPAERLRQFCRDFIRFCFEHRNTYEMILAVQAERVDATEPRNELNRRRNALFGLLMQALQDCLPLDREDERLLAFSRITFYMLHGIAGTYAHSDESPEALFARLASTFDAAIDVLLHGFHHQLEKG